MNDGMQIHPMLQLDKNLFTIFMGVFFNQPDTFLHQYFQQNLIFMNLNRLSINSALIKISGQKAHLME